MRATIFVAEIAKISPTILLTRIEKLFSREKREDMSHRFVTRFVKDMSHHFFLTGVVKVRTTIFLTKIVKICPATNFLRKIAKIRPTIFSDRNRKSTDYHFPYEICEDMSHHFSYKNRKNTDRHFR